MRTLRPYLTYSFTLHLAIAFAAAVFLGRQTAKTTPVYMIDFVGPSAIVQSGSSSPASQAGPSAPAAASEPKTEPRSPTEFVPSRKSAPLPKPSLLKGYKEPIPEPGLSPEAPPPGSEAPAGVGEATGEAGPPGSAGIATDMPNFPYPWYISQIRASLWAQWSSRMPGAKGEAVVVFSILPNGGMVDLRIEASSGDEGFDLAAQGAVQDAAPFPALPSGFTDPFLKIHVTLKSR